MREKIKDHWVYVFAKNNVRYLAAIGVFVLAIVYTQAFPEVKKIEKNKKISYQSRWETEKYDLGGKILEKTYFGLSNSAAGDFYRLGFYARAIKDEKIFVKIKSLFGQEKEIGAIELRGEIGEEENNSQYFEIVFPVNGNYGDIIFSREKEETERISAGWEEIENNDEKTKKEIIWDNNRIFLSGITVSRLNVKNETETKNLKRTVLGEVKTKKIYLPDNGAGGDNYLAGQIFEAQNEFLLSAGMNLKKFGNGGTKKYALELNELNGNGSKKEKRIQRIYFHAGDLVDALDDDGNIFFNFPAKLEKGKQYFIGVNRKKAKENSVNYLRAEKIGDSESRIALLLMDSPEYNEIKLLSGAKIEDIGEKYLYSYQNSGQPVDWLDIFDFSGKIDFDTKKEIVFGKTQKVSFFSYRFDFSEKDDFDIKKAIVFGKAGQGNFFSYKVNTLYSIEKMRVEAIGHGNKRNFMNLEYSFDNKFWQKIPYQQEKGESQMFDYAINGNGNSSVLYFRMSPNVTKSEKESDEIYGLELFKLTGDLAKK